MKICTFIIAVFAGCLSVLPAYSQETDRSPFRLELPEAETGQMSDAKVYIANAKVNVVKFWILNPAADGIEWSTIKVRINNNSANRVCAQSSSSLGKIMKCDLNKLAGFRLAPLENRFEIEASGNDGKRYFASFLAVTDPKRAVSSNGSKNGKLGFSGRKFAVVIGVSKYQYNDVGLGNLNFADKDAAELKNWLITSGGFAVEDVLYMVNADATLSAVRDSLNRFLTRATENDLVLFFFAGHGTPDPFNPTELYYLVHDSKVGDLKRTGFPMTELKAIVDRKISSTRAIFLLDTCHSGGVSGKKVVPFKTVTKGNRGLDDGTGERILERPVEIRNDVSQAAGRLFASRGRAILSSSDVSETSREGSRWGGGHGVFTWVLLQGLKGLADSNSDRVVTTGELFQFVRSRVNQETGGKQNPSLISGIGEELEIAVIK
ncbi:MAG: caspase family protein [Acidobacteria bacterium]|nr:caspase family protein [Acidobacteriota bacterium]MBK8150070.1 caspase family protein [Acidobacteriota bacterium]MBK8811032.1 caspase family protein [Acidobacteriota bacterium]